VLRAIARMPADRFASADALSHAVDSLDDEGHGRLPFPARKSRSSDRMRTMMLGASTVVVTLGSLSYAALLRPPTPVPPRIADLLRHCRSVGEDAPTRSMRATLTVLGGSGEVIDAKALLDPDDPERRECVEAALYQARFGRFDKPTQQTFELDVSDR